MTNKYLEKIAGLGSAFNMAKSVVGAGANTIKASIPMVKSVAGTGLNTGKAIVKANPITSAAVGGAVGGSALTRMASNKNNNHSNQYY